MAPDFSARTVDTLSRRAALRCSNPDCDKLTTGPNTDNVKATNIGEAAHIYGARPGAARYRSEMSDEERASITNAIWLCSDCHGRIDKDPGRFPDTLLFLWREKHEEKLLNEIGKPGELIRRLAADRELRSLGDLPLYAEQLIREKPPHWEYMLTAELLDFYIKPVMRSARDLQLGLISKPKIPVNLNDIPNWLSRKVTELAQVPHAMTALIEELKVGWGPPGEPGDPATIKHVCELFGKAAHHMVAIADEVRFTALPDYFDGLAKSLMEGALHPLRRVPEMAAFIRSIFEKDDIAGEHYFSLVFDLPDGWSEKLEGEIQAAYRELSAEL